jgi:hypothetical protein
LPFSFSFSESGRLLKEPSSKALQDRLKVFSVYFLFFKDFIGLRGDQVHKFSLVFLMIIYLRRKHSKTQIIQKRRAGLEPLSCSADPYVANYSTIVPFPIYVINYAIYCMEENTTQ